ncbi:MFS transporter [Robertmurraya kyonggiensis]|uniref:MFS transporter n=1 Tax=Robertmurraya kyonggiensis TaxID=1037680 RepID=A0A4U1D7R7_9BACI|nr:MFS transporter [Robertmurraya kyonggiensis]TKC18013.1 MFS transporter [Robertmurraya kyonggiensis]
MVVRIVVAIALTYQIMINITRPIVSLYATNLGANMAEIGYLTATYAFFPLLLAIPIGKISDRIGDRIPTILGTIGVTVGICLPFVFQSMWALYVSQALIGISQIFINVNLQNMIGTVSTSSNRDKNYSYFSLGVALGTLIGPVVGGYLAEHYSYHFSYLIATLIGIAPIILAILLPVIKRKIEEEKEDEKTKGKSAFNLLKIPNLRKALLASSLVLYSRDIYIAYFPIYAESVGYSVSTIGWILTVMGLASVAVRSALPMLINRFGRERVLLSTLAIAGIAFICIPVFDNIIGFYIFAALMGAGLGCGQPLSMSTIYNASPVSRKAEALGLRLATNRFSQVIAPLLFGLIGTVGGLSPVFYLSGIFLLGGSYITRETEKKEELPHASNDG